MTVLDARDFAAHVRRLAAQDLYSGDGARFYAALVDRDRSEVQCYRRLARETSGDLIDLAAGSGRLTLPLAAMQRRVIAVDSSPVLIEELRRRARELGLPSGRLSAEVADIRTWAPPRAAGLVIIGATSIALFSAQERRALFGRIAGWLGPGGRLAFSTPLPSEQAPSPHPSLYPLAVGAGPGAKLGILFEVDEPGADRRLTGVLVLPTPGGAAELSAYVSDVWKPTTQQIVAELGDAGLEVSARIGMEPPGGGGAVGMRRCAVYVCAPAGRAR